MTQVAAEGFNQHTQLVHDPMGVALDFVSGYDAYKKLAGQFDFTKVDRDAGQNLLDLASRQLSRKAFETVGGVVDKGLEIFASAMGATGQWYGVAGTLLGEQALDWAEKRFETFMDWTDVEEAQKGDWVVIDLDQRRRLPDMGFMEEVLELEHSRVDGAAPTLSKKQPLKKNLHVGLDDGTRSDGFHKVTDMQDNEVKWVSPGAVTKLPNQDELWADSKWKAMGNALQVEERHAASRLDVPVNTRVGDKVVFRGETWMLASNSSVHEARIVANGVEKTVRWHELTPAVNDTTNTPLPGNPSDTGFATTGDYHAGDYVWVMGRPKNYLACVQNSYGSRDLIIVNTMSGDASKVPVNMVATVTDGYTRGTLFGYFARAVVEKSYAGIMKYLPGHENPRLCESYTSEYFGNPHMSHGSYDPLRLRGGGAGDDPPTVSNTNQKARARDQRQDRLSGQEPGGFPDARPGFVGDGGMDVEPKKKGTDNSLYVVLGCAVVAAFVLSA